MSKPTVDEVLEQFAVKEIELSYDGAGGLTDQYKDEAKAALRTLIDGAMERVIGNYTGSDLVLLSNQREQRQRKATVLDELFGGRDE